MGLRRFLPDPLLLDAEQRKHDLRELFNSLRWLVERIFGWMSRFRRLAEDHEHLATTLVGLHCVTFVCLLSHRAVPLLKVHGTLKGGNACFRWVHPARS